MEVGGLKVQLTVSTTVGGGCWTVITALVNDTSVIVSVQLEFGQPGAPGIGDTGALVVTLNATLPFLIADAGMATDPVKVTAAGFCPGGLLTPEGLVQVAVGLPVADRLTCRFVFPSPASAPDAVKVRPLSVKLREPFKWTLFANANVVMRQTIISADSNAMPNRRMVFSFANKLKKGRTFTLLVLPRTQRLLSKEGSSMHFEASLQTGLLAAQPRTFLRGVLAAPPKIFLYHILVFLSSFFRLFR